MPGPAWYCRLRRSKMKALNRINALKACNLETTAKPGMAKTTSETTEMTATALCLGSRNQTNYHQTSY